MARDLVVEEMRREPRVALVIGNAAYDQAPLKNPVNDARAVAQALESCGFSVIRRFDSDKQAMFEAIREFGRRIQRGGVGLFYYAGHGMQVKGRNYLVPIETDIKAEDEIEFQCIDAGLVLRKMESAGNRVNVVVLDACRNNPFARSFRSGTRGLGQMDAATGSLLAYATAPGMVAADGEGANGLYTAALLDHLTQPGVPIEQVFKNVRRDIIDRTGRQQIPWESSSLTGEFFFVLPEAGGTAAVTAAPPPPPPPTGHLQVNVNVAQARVLVDGVYRGQATAGAPLNLSNAGQGTVEVRVEAPGYAPGTQQYALEGNQWTQAVFRLVQAVPPPPPAADLAGTPPGPVPSAKVQLAPAAGRMVEVGDSLLVDLHEVSNAEFAEFLNRRGNQEEGGQYWARVGGDARLEMRDGFFAAKVGFADHPATDISWYGAQAYCDWAGKRLPTEAEWQQACQPGEQAYPWGTEIDRTRANYGSETCCATDDSDGYARTAPVGSFLAGASPSGALDMAGNVWEWTDTTQGKVRAVRGGSWNSAPAYLACAYRHGFYPAERHPYIGFRCAR